MKWMSIYRPPRNYTCPLISLRAQREQRSLRHNVLINMLVFTLFALNSTCHNVNRGKRRENACRSHMRGRGQTPAQRVGTSAPHEQDDEVGSAWPVKEMIQVKMTCTWWGKVLTHGDWFAKCWSFLKILNFVVWAIEWAHIPYIGF